MDGPWYGSFLNQGKWNASCQTYILLLFIRTTNRPTTGNEYLHSNHGKNRILLLRGVVSENYIHEIMASPKFFRLLHRHAKHRSFFLSSIIDEGKTGPLLLPKTSVLKTLVSSLTTNAHQSEWVTLLIYVQSSDFRLNTFMKNLQPCSVCWAPSYTHKHTLGFSQKNATNSSMGVGFNTMDYGMEPDTVDRNSMG